jgi:hypothetical protein
VAELVEFKHSHERGSSFSTDWLLGQGLRGMVKSSFLLGRGTNFHLIFSLIVSCIPVSLLFKGFCFLCIFTTLKMRALWYPVGADRVSQQRLRFSLFQPQPGLKHPVGTDGVPLSRSFFESVFPLSWSFFFSFPCALH